MNMIIIIELVNHVLYLAKKNVTLSKHNNILNQ